MKGVPIHEAAKELDVAVVTLRKWIARGAPTVRPGEVGRGRGALVCVEDLLRWRGGGSPLSDSEFDKKLAEGVMDPFRRDDLPGRLGIHPRIAAAALALVFERLHKNFLKRPPELGKLPEEIDTLLSISLE